MNFNGNLLLGFGRYWGKELPPPALFHLFRAPALATLQSFDLMKTS